MIEGDAERLRRALNATPEERQHLADAADREGRCPDGGYCHGSTFAAGSTPCDPGTCFRVRTSGPLSGVFPGDRWPEEVDCANGVKPARPPVYLVAGRTPAALELARALDDPEVRARIEESLRQLAEVARNTVEVASAAFARAIDAYRPLVEQLRDAGVLPEHPPEDPRERALWLRRHRGTGPDRQVQHRPRPRRIG